jgi:hypothetical protein
MDALIDDPKKPLHRKLINLSLCGREREFFSCLLKQSRLTLF